MIPEQLQNPNFKFIKIKQKDKIPVESNWQSTANYGFDSLILKQWLQRGGNYGIVCGYGKLVVIDADKPEVVEAIEKLLPDTYKVKTGREGTHFYYICNDLDKPIRLSSGDALGDVGDVQWTGKQVIAPNSTHPNGKKYTPLNDNSIAEVTAEQIKTALHFWAVNGNNKCDDLSDIEKGLNISDVISTGGMQSHGKEYYGAHPIHGSDGGMNFWVNPTKNVWHCFRHETGGGPLSWIAVKEGIINCDEAVKGALKGEKFKKVLKIAQEKYGLEEMSVENLPTNTITLPAMGKSVSEFSNEIADVLADKNCVFYRIDSRDVVEIGEIEVKTESKQETRYLGFIPLTPTSFVTLIEKFANIGKVGYNQQTGNPTFKSKSISGNTAGIILSSYILREKLPQIQRIFSVPLPIKYNGKITFPKKGYDIRFGSWLPHDAPEITEPEMPLEEAKRILVDVVFKEFCWERKGKDLTMAISGLLTPFLRGLYSDMTVRTPLFIYLANREGVGKDFAAGISGIVYEGVKIDEPALSTGEKWSGNSDELRKKIFAALSRGRKRMHFSNNKGFLNNSTLEAVLTAEHWNDRKLGKSEECTLSNEMDFSLSGNRGIKYTPDLARRSRFVKQFFAMEDVNGRVFERPDLHDWIKKNRGKVLSALYALIRDWEEKGEKKGTEPFTSYPEWANICGGIMENAGFGSPCELEEEDGIFDGDIQTVEMKELFELCYSKSPNAPMPTDEIRTLVEDDGDILTEYDFTTRKDSTAFGMLLSSFTGRILGDIKMSIKDKKAKGRRKIYIFSKEADDAGTLRKWGGVL